MCDGTENYKMQDKIPSPALWHQNMNKYNLQYMTKVKTERAYFEYEKQF